MKQHLIKIGYLIIAKVLYWLASCHCASALTVISSTGVEYEVSETLKVRN